MIDEMVDKVEHWYRYLDSVLKGEEVGKEVFKIGDVLRGRDFIEVDNDFYINKVRMSLRGLHHSNPSFIFITFSYTSPSLELPLNYLEKMHLKSIYTSLKEENAALEKIVGHAKLQELRSKILEDFVEDLPNE